jgi:hypothetical protein
MFNPTLRFVSDPGHGWLRAPRRLIDMMGISDSVSHYSYITEDGEHVYLEEDCDAPKLIQAMRAHGMDPRIVHATPSNGNSFVRRLGRFTLVAA